ncbi:MAG TPA: carboxypeptidase-like regulatory domain-containing protein [Bryobacteraceae bacterium]|nr:carboxypeptidase-like regulatory domain-containing protein [Bryobacteraceae bacterium]
MHLFRSASFALAALALYAQQAAAPRRQQPSKAETCSIEGRVISAASGEGVNNAEIGVYAPDNQRYTTTTRADGRFAVQEMESGRYRLYVSKRGFARFMYGARGNNRAGSTLSLDPGQRLADLVLRISPQGVITGRVLDEDGDPVPFVMVQLTRYGFDRGKRQLQAWGGGSTNDLGEYRIFGVSQGKYYLSAAMETDPEQYGTQGYVATYYPRAVDPAGATAIEVRPGSLVRGVDITLLKTRTVSVRGRVIDPGKEPMGASVQLIPRDQPEYMWGRSFANMDQQGSFEFRGVVPGAYYIDVRKYGNRITFGARQALDVPESGVANVALELVPSAELKGQLRVEGRPASLSDAHITLRADEPSDTGWAGGPVKADGSFTVSNIGSLHYELMVNGLPEDYYLKSARLGGTEVQDTGIDATSGMTGSLDIVMSSNSGQIEGVVLDADDQPVTAATVSLVPDEPRRARPRFYRVVTTDQYGRFILKGVVPGGYKLFAWEDIADGQYEDPEFLKSYETQGWPVTVRERSHESAQLKLIPAQETPAPKLP